MINSKENAVEWAQLLFEQGDAHEHLGDLIKEMSSRGEIDTEAYAVDMAHMFAHLNRAWNSRNLVGEITDENHEKYSCYPCDLEPLASKI